LRGLLGEGSPTTMSSMMARMRMIMAVVISMRMGVHRCCVGLILLGSGIISIMV
jgi:hypothetical protein